MKKLYSFLSVLAVAALGVNAATPMMSKTAKFMSKAEVIAKAKSLEDAQMSHKLPSTAKAPVARVAAPMADILGQYTCTYTTTDATGVIQQETILTFSEFDATTIEVMGFFSNAGLYGTYDPSTGVASLDFEDLGTVKTKNDKGETITVMLSYKMVTIDANSYFQLVDVPTYDITYNGDGWDAPQGSEFLALVGLDPETGELTGVFELYLRPTITRLVWEEVGTATFNDGIFGRFIINQQTGEEEPQVLTTEVTVEQLQSNPGSIRLVKAFASYGMSENFELDITDPNNIIIPFQITSMDLGAGPTALMSYSAFGEPFTDEEIQSIKLNASNLITFGKYSVYYAFPYSELPNVPSDEAAPDFGEDMPTSIQLPADFNAGIGNVNVATSDKVEYFNLQGIRIENPTHGLYIRRAGKKVEKVIL